MSLRQCVRCSAAITFVLNGCVVDVTDETYADKKKETTCEFFEQDNSVDAMDLWLGHEYVVDMFDGDIKNGKDYVILVEFESGGEPLELSGTVERGAMRGVSLSFLDEDDFALGSGTIRIYERTAKRNKKTGEETVELKPKGECSLELDGCFPTHTACAEEQECGTIDDGCGNEISCGDEAEVCDMAGGETCGGGGVPNQCGVCVPMRTCESENAQCGVIDDGCGNEISCGDESAVCDVAAGETCGGGGVANHCGNLPCGGDFYCQPCGPTGQLNPNAGRAVNWPTGDNLVNDNAWVSSVVGCYWIARNIEDCRVGPNVCGLLGPIVASSYLGCGCISR